MLIAGNPATFAQEYVVIHPKGEGVQPVEVPLTAELKLSFTTDGFTVGAENVGNARKFSYADVEKITFGEGTSGICDVIDAGVSLTLAENPVGDLLVVNGHDSSSPATLRINALNGSQVVLIDGWNGEAVDASKLTSGLYILSINSKTIKFIKK